MSIIYISYLNAACTVGHRHNDLIAIAAQRYTHERLHFTGIGQLKKCSRYH